MTAEQYYKILAEKHKHVDWNDIESIKKYNEEARVLRHKLYESQAQERSKKKS